MLQVVAIDGVSGSGKSSTARLLAKALGFSHLDTGAMYRMVTFVALQKGLNPKQTKELGEIAQKIVFSFSEKGELWANGEPLPQQIRSSEVSSMVSEFCKPSEVRVPLSKQQRLLGESRPTVVEGRDIASHVFRDAPWKFFLTAKPEIRAIRRLREMEKAGIPAQYEDILANLLERDAKDTSRVLNPLLKTADALEIDTSGLTLEGQVAMLTRLVQASLTVEQVG